MCVRHKVACCISGATLLNERTDSGRAGQVGKHGRRRADTGATNATGSSPLSAASSQAR